MIEETVPKNPTYLSLSFPDHKNPFLGHQLIAFIKSQAALIIFKIWPLFSFWPLKVLLVAKIRLKDNEALHRKTVAVPGTNRVELISSTPVAHSCKDQQVD